MRKSFFNIVLLFILVSSIISCDKDFNSLGSDVIGDDNFNLEKYEVQNLIAYSKETGPVQANNLPINAIGIYKNPVLGTTKAQFVSQVELTTAAPTIGYGPVIDSVYLYVPYFNTLKSTASSGERIYELDSVYGYSETAKFKLHVYENGYFLRDFDPSDDLESAQKYYSNEKNLIDAYKGTELLNNSTNVAQNEEFLISNKELYIYKTNGSGLYVDADGDVLSNQSDIAARVIKERKAPGIWLDLKNSFFQQKILDAAASGVLFNNNTFKEYFRGLLFEVEEIQPDQGAMALLDFSAAEFKILYKASLIAPTVDEPNPTKTRRTLSLQMGYKASSSKKSNCINFIEHTNSVAYNNGLSASNELTGDEKLYLKGGNGSVAFLDVFGPDLDLNEIPDELEQLRANVINNKWLINEANLTFYVDKTSLSLPNQVEPERIYIFDATNNKPIIDYYADASTSADAKKNKSSFGGIIERDENEKGIKYRIRLTEYIRQLVKGNNDGEYSDNIRIGVAVIESINIPENAYINPANPISIGGDQVDFVPVSSVMNPLGTILYGTNVLAADEDKKLKLEIYFTKPNN